MYHLKLTATERKAIDWIGDRYAHGHDLYKVLWVQAKPTPEDADWDSPCDITFVISESVAWQIHEIAEECEYRWDCFAPSLATKLTRFCEQIV
jgi:hypothetical protein